MIRLAAKRTLRPFVRAYRRFAGHGTVEAQSLTLDRLAVELSSLRAATDKIILRLARTDDLQLSVASLHNVLNGTKNDIADVQSELQRVIVQRFDELSVSVLYGLSEKLDLLHGKFDQAPWSVLYNLSEKIDILLHARNAAERTDLHISREVDRLDGYLNYHVDQLQQTVKKEISEQTREGIEKLSLPVLISVSEKIDILNQKSTDLGVEIPEQVKQGVEQVSMPALISVSEKIDRLIKVSDSLDSEFVYTAPTLEVIVKYFGFDVIVPSSEVGLLAYIKRHGLSQIEPAVRAALKRHIKPGDVVVDGGVNLGIHSLTMAEAVGPKGKLLGFEALPHMASVATRTLRLNGFESRSRIMQAALAEKNGDTSFNVSAHSPNSSMFPLPNVDTTTVTVPRTTLDAQITPGERVDFIKLDIEGAEPLAWKGMSRILMDNPHVHILMEWSASHFSRSGADASLFIGEIQSLGFKPWLLRDDAPEHPMLINASTAELLEGENLLFCNQP